jgi:hypothetical protein
MLNLFSLAQENMNELAQWHKSYPPSDEELKFLSTIESLGDISINVHLFNLVEILYNDVVKNMYEVTLSDKEIAEDAWEEARSIDITQMLRERLRLFYEKRILFDQIFAEYAKFKYTALNSCGLGLAKYGSFCLNFDRFRLEIVFLAKESLKYIDDNLQFDIDLFKKEISPNDYLPILALRKHQNELTTPGFSFSNICEETNYIEGIILGDLTTSHISDVRVSIDIDHSYRDLYCRYYGGAALDEQEKMMLRLFLKMRKLLKSKNIQLKKL